MDWPEGDYESESGVGYKGSERQINVGHKVLWQAHPACIQREEPLSLPKWSSKGSLAEALLVKHDKHLKAGGYRWDSPA